MREPIRLVSSAYALVTDDRRPEINDVITIGLIGHVTIEVDATVIELEISDDGEHAILLDHTGCRWALPVQPHVERAA